MQKCAIDFLIVIDSDHKIIDYTIFEQEELQALDPLLADQTGGDIENCIPIHVDKGGGYVEFGHLHFMYQVMPLYPVENNLYQVVFSHRTMDAVVYAKAMDKIEEGIHIYNSQGYAMFINGASERLSGIKKEEFEGRHLMDLYNLDENYSTTLTALRTKKAVLNRCDVFTTVDNKPLTTINSAFPIMIDNNLIGTILMENDVKMLQKQSHKNQYLNEYLVTSCQDRKKSKYFHFNDIVHRSKKMADLIHVAKKVSLNDSSILIYGETGTGKELLAQSIHQFGKKGECPFVAVNCAAIPSNLAESLFFGTVKGAFTGSENTEGFFSQANGGTLFLDEVNSMSLEMQSKLLRVLQSKKYRKVGSKKEHPVSVRIIAASNDNLRTLVENKEMRSDFYYRISPIVLELPSLSERIEDIGPLTEHFIKHFNELNHRQVKGLSKSVNRLFENYNWPGNIRELENILEYGFAMIGEEEHWLNEAHLPEYMKLNKVTYSIKRPLKQAYAEIESLESQMNQHEKKVLEEALMMTHFNVSATAKLLGIKRQSLQYRMKKYNMSKE